jgi:hypothetical protein
LRCIALDICFGKLKNILSKIAIMRLLLICVFISLACTNTRAQISFKTEYFGSSSYRVSEGDTDEKVGNSKGSAAVYQGGINIPLSLRLNENNRPEMWSISAGFAYAKLNNKNFTEPLVIDEIMNIGLSLNYLRPLNDKWSLKASIGGGIFMPGTNLSEMGFKNVLGSASVIFIRHLRPNLKLGGGLALNNSFGVPMVFPAFYLDWTTEGRYAVKISLKEGFEISAGYSFNQNLKLSFIAEINGQMALLEQDGEDKIFTHQYIVIGFRPEIKVGKHITIPVTLGLNAMRPTQITDRSLKTVFQDKGYYFQASPYASAGLLIGF